MRNTFTKTNYLLLVAGFVIVVIGFILMGGPSTSDTAYEPDIFSVRRTVVAPLVALFGFLFVIAAILWHQKPSQTTDTNGLVAGPRDGHLSGTDRVPARK